MGLGLGLGLGLGHVKVRVTVGSCWRRAPQLTPLLDPVQVSQPACWARLQMAVPEHFEKCSSMTFFVRQSGSMPTATFALQRLAATTLWGARPDPWLWGLWGRGPCRSAGSGTLALLRTPQEGPHTNKVRSIVPPGQSSPRQVRHSVGDVYVTMKTCTATASFIIKFGLWGGYVGETRETPRPAYPRTLHA